MKGRPRGIKSPKHLLEQFENYKDWAKKNPWQKKDFIRSGEFAGQIVNLEIERPLTEWEFASFLKMSYRALTNYGSAEGYEDFFPIYAQIKTEMVANRISGGLIGAYNANLVARIDGLKEQTETELSGTLNFSIADKIKEARERSRNL